MPRIERDAEIVWEGNLARGEGRLSAASSGAFNGLPISVATRVGAPEGRTSPEELLAAAHGGCFASSLAGELTGLGHPPGRLELSCRVVMDEVAGSGHQIVGSELVVTASVPGLDADTLARALVLADEGCPFSALLKRGGADVSVQASLRDAGA
jgi:osmotically inducible protein OsmC